MTVRPEQLNNLLLKLADPTIVGPGQWFTIHTEAKDAIDSKSKQRFIATLDNIVTNMKCDNCKSHALKYIDNNDPIVYWDKKKIVKLPSGKVEVSGMFLWSCKFHNVVNARLNKDIINIETATSLYYISSSKCKGSCGVPIDEDDNHYNKPHYMDDLQEMAEQYIRGNF